MKIIGCLNMREKDGGQSSVTVGCVYLPVSFFNACTSDYLRTERLFLQRPISPQMASRCFSYFAALLLEIRNIAFFIIRFSNLTKGRVFSSESKQNVRFRLFQNGCNRRNDSFYSFLLLPKSVAANNKNLYRTASLFERQALFADAFGCLNSWFNPGNLSRRLLRRNLLSNIGFFTLNQLSANGKSQPSTTGRDSRTKGSNDVAKMIYLLREFASKEQKCSRKANNGCNDKANYQHTFKTLLKKFDHFFAVHSFLRVLGLDFCLTAQILPSTPETNFVRMG